MAQKIFPKSLRSQKQLSQDFSFYSEKTYSSVWATAYKLTNIFYAFCQKNFVYKNKRKGGQKQRRGKKNKTIPTYLNTRFYISNLIGSFKVSPILFMFAQGSLSKKYSPIKPARRNPAKTKMLGKNSFKKVFLRKYVKNVRGSVYEILFKKKNLKSFK